MIHQKNAISVVQLKTMLKRLAERAEVGSAEARDRAIGALIDAYRDENLVLVLGAGVSIELGLLDWTTLLQKLLLASIVHTTQEDEQRSDVLAKLFNKVFKPNPLVAARHLHDFYRRQFDTHPLAFNNAVRDALYATLEKDKESSLLTEIRELCIAAGRSPNLRCIITYNYDDVIETDLAKVGVEIRFKSIHTPGSHAKPNELALYHVHGFLPRNGPLGPEHRIILSEDLYHQQYTDIYGWSNLVQINTFKDGNCFFIGTSFTDPNQRRLLEIAKTLRGDDVVHHYCIRKRYEPDRVEKALNHVLEEDPQIVDEKQRAELTLETTVKDLVDVMENFEEQDARSFGIGTLWVKDYAEIPNLLKQIRRMQRTA